MATSECSSTDGITVRRMTPSDPAVIARAFVEQGWTRTVEQYDGYLADQAGGRRLVLLAEWNHRFAGYLTVVWSSWYEGFRRRGVPEIADLNVLEAFQRRGIASRLLDEAEAHIAERSPVAGIGVGLMANYGPAQRLYVRRGYVPDGAGLFANERALAHGDTTRVDDDLVLYLEKAVCKA